jgi:hypothetical protein
VSPSASRSRGESLRAMHARTCLVSCLAALGACTAAPEPPPTPQAVVQLSLRYDRPTGTLDEALAREIVDARWPHVKALKTLAGLSFLREVIAEGTTPDIEGADSIDVQGSLAVHAPCPGWERVSAATEAETGFVELMMGVDASRVQRAFTGRATACRFSAQRGKERVNVTASMAVELDLGRSLGLGEAVPSLLVRFSELSSALSIDSTGSSVALALADIADDGDALSLRMGGDAVLETLVDLETLGMGQQGTFLLALLDDSSVRLRGRDSAWVCSSKRSDPCVRTD